MNIDQLKLGKLQAEHDDRTIKLSAILNKTLPPIPAVYDFDQQHPGCDMPMFLNDQLGDCVIAGRAHMTRRFELIEQSKVIKITDAEVKKEYFKESGGQDSGLNMLDALNAWRKGWKAAGKTYNVDAFASVKASSNYMVSACIALLSGCYVGVALPLSAQKQVGKVWTITTGASARPGTWGGHCIYLVAYNLTGPICITWGARQQMTWAWLAKYCDEAFGVVDNRDSWLTKATIDVPKMEGMLKEITA